MVRWRIKSLDLYPELRVAVTKEVRLPSLKPNGLRFDDLPQPF